jgi:cytochrome P450
MRALLENPDQRQLLLDEPSLIPSAVEEALRMFPAFSHFRRTATRDTEIAGRPIREGDKVVMWYLASNRDESRYEDPDRFDVTRNPSTRRSARADATSASGRPSLGWSCASSSRRRCGASPGWSSPGR